MVGGMLPPGLTADKAGLLHDRIQKITAKQDAPEMDTEEVGLLLK